MKEEFIENNILAWLHNKWFTTAEKNITEWWYDQKSQTYKKNKSNFVKRGRSDIQVLINWKFVAIEVKQPSEIDKFDKPLKILQERYIAAQIRLANKPLKTFRKSIKPYLHALEQKQYIEEIKMNWWYWFYCSWVADLEKKLKELEIL